MNVSARLQNNILTVTVVEFQAKVNRQKLNDTLLYCGILRSLLFTISFLTVESP